jgi:hypothetical protein
MELSNILGGQNHVIDVSFGWRQSYFVIFTVPGGKHSKFYDLKGHYEDLWFFLSHEKNENIVILVSIVP